MPQYQTLDESGAHVAASVGAGGEVAYVSRMPAFSIIVPMYNRQAEIRRALDSCIRQSDGDFEVIVVDDASTDSSFEVAGRYSDARIHVLRHVSNRGACAARNTAAAAASGDWLIMLDSDDELLPGALAAIRQRTREAGAEADKLLLMCQYADGTISPDPPFSPAIWNFDEYVAWHERMIGRRSEAMPVVRRTAFLECPYPDSHAPEGLHDLNFLLTRRVYVCPDVVRVYHQDAAARLIRPSSDWWRRNGASFARAADQVIDLHGPALARSGPTLLQNYRRAAAYAHFFAGNRRRGLRRATQALRTNPRLLGTWATMFLGMLGPRALALSARLRSSRS